MTASGDVCSGERLALLEKYSVAGPRYTSYPTAPAFTTEFAEEDYRSALARGSGPLSLYIHLPFCRHVCWFCACSVVYTNNQGRVAPYLALLNREMELLRPDLAADRSVSHLHLGGGTPTFLTPAELLELGAMLRRHFVFTAEAELGIELDPRTATRAHLDALDQIGFNRASLGVQDFAPKVQEAVNRVQPFEQTADLLAELRRRGYRELNVDLIYGLPHQTKESFAGTLEKILSLRPDRVSLFQFAYLPDLKKHQRNIHPEDLPQTHARIELFESALAQLNQGGYTHIGMDHFALPQSALARAQAEHRLHRNFQGYVAGGDPDLIGLGVTAIGRPARDVFAQNARSIESYRALLEAGRLPVERGLRLSKDDLVRGQVIQEIICHFELDFGTVEREFSVEFRSYFAKELNALEDFVREGLVTFTEAGVRVTESGRFVVRNICMVFDAHLEDQRAGGRTFSRTV